VPDQAAVERRQQPQAPSGRRFTAEISAFHGPVPPPAILAEYNQIIPDGANRILAMAERQQAHRHELEGTVVRSNVTNERRGQLFAFIIAMTAILGGLGLILSGRDTEGLVAILGTLTALASVFVYGRYKQAQEREQKRREAREAAEQPRLPLSD
jgi:uncharacterized membrane protein